MKEKYILVRLLTEFLNKILNKLERHNIILHELQVRHMQQVLQLWQLED